MATQTWVSRLQFPSTCKTMFMAFLLTLVGANTVDAQTVRVLTHYYNIGRTGLNNKEITLTTANVNPTSFGLLYTVPLDDEVDAQPLVWVDRSGQAIVYVVTASNTLYWFDPGSGTVLGTLNFGPPVPQTSLPGACGDNGPNIGVSSTPVIHGSTLYLIAYTLENNAPVYRVHGVNLTTGREIVPGGAVVTASHTLTDGTTYNFDPSILRQRPALLYANGNVYAGFGSFCDFIASRQRGWLLGWSGATLTPLASNQLNNIIDTEPTPRPAFRVSLWMSGAGIAADKSGNLWFATANSGQGSTFNSPDSIQQSVVEMSPDLSTILDIFTPSNYASLDSTDMELGAGGVLLIPQQPLPIPSLATAAGKDGNMYLLNRDALGGVGGQLGAFPIGGMCFCAESYFVGADGISRVVSSGGGNVIVWKLQSTGTGSTLAQESQSELIQNRPGFFTSVSSNRRLAGSAIIWAITHPSASQPLSLVAMDATNSQIIYQAIAGPWSNGKHPNQVPVVANGRVLAASYKQVAVFGLGGTAGSPATVAAQFAPSVPQGAPTSGNLIDGTVATVSGSTFELTTSTGLTSVDATQAEAEELAVDIYVGRTVTVRGTFDSAGVLVAESVYD